MAGNFLLKFVRMGFPMFGSRLAVKSMAFYPALTTDSVPLIVDPSGARWTVLVWVALGFQNLYIHFGAYIGKEGRVCMSTLYV